jgi:hypothetical protein
VAHLQGADPSLLCRRSDRPGARVEVAPKGNSDGYSQEWLVLACAERTNALASAQRWAKAFMATPPTPPSDDRPGDSSYEGCIKRVNSRATPSMSHFSNRRSGVVLGCAVLWTWSRRWFLTTSDRAVSPSRYCRFRSGTDGSVRAILAQPFKTLVTSSICWSPTAAPPFRKGTRRPHPHGQTDGAISRLPERARRDREFARPVRSDP